MCFRWFLVFNSSMGNIPCFCDFPARSQIYSVKCQISHFWEIELNYLPDVMGSFKVSFIDNANLRLHSFHLIGFTRFQNHFSTKALGVSTELHEEDHMCHNLLQTMNHSPHLIAYSLYFETIRSCVNIS